MEGYFFNFIFTLCNKQSLYNIKLIFFSFHYFLPGIDYNSNVTIAKTCTPARFQDFLSKKCYMRICCLFLLLLYASFISRRFDLTDAYPDIGASVENVAACLADYIIKYTSSGKYESTEIAKQIQRTIQP